MDGVVYTNLLFEENQRKKGFVEYVYYGLHIRKGSQVTGKSSFPSPIHGTFPSIKTPSI